MQNKFQFENTHYEFLSTEDQSPSICMWSDSFRPEAMHHRKGALSESLFIYYDSLLFGILEMKAPPSLLSVGVGCAYNELLMATFLLQHPDCYDGAYIESFEGDLVLRTEFLNWIQGTPTSSDLGRKLQDTFEIVTEFIASHFKIKAGSIKNTLKQLYGEKRFVVRGWLNEKTEFPQQFGVVFYDAFSNQSTPEIWQESFLDKLLNMIAADKCIFATYASTGALKRSLRKADFQLIDQAGFAGKRQSTRAIRLTNSGQLRSPMLGSLND